MKRTDTLTKIVSMLLFGALLAYMGYYFFDSLTNNVRTAPAVYVSLTESSSAPGIIIREERLIQSSENFLSIVAENGRLLAVGDTVAVAYKSEDALSRAGQIRELETQKQYIRSVLAGRNNTDTLPEKDKAIKAAITDLAAASARGETDKLSRASLELGSLVIETTKTSATEEDLDRVTNELFALKQTAIYDTKPLTAQISGLFTAGVDGYEYIKPSEIKEITPEKLRSLSDTPQEIPTDVIGKVVSPYEWFFASIMTTEDADRLEVGGSASMDFGRYCGGPVKATVICKRATSNGECAVVFRCTSSMSDLLSVRKVTAEVVFSTREGIRVPKKAVMTDENGTYVYTLTALQAEKKYISILWETEDFYLVESSGDAAALRDGNDIILTTRGMYDGKLIG